MIRQPITVVSGPAAPLLRANVDTDAIIRIEHLTQTPRSELGRHALQALRYLPDGSVDPRFALNQSTFRDAPILLAGPNFGCGSSREHAVWALQGLGLRCIIAPSFGDIFYTNCFQNGMLPIRLPLEVVEDLAEQCVGGLALEVDLRTCSISAPEGSVFAFSIDSRRRDGLLHGLDEIGLTLKDETKIAIWQSHDRRSRPWAWPSKA